VTIQLRYLQTLTEIGAEKNTTIAFPIPIDMITSFMGGGNKWGDGPKPPSAPRTPAPEPLTEPPASEEGMEPETGTETPERRGPIPRYDLENAPPPRPKGPIQKA
jgi:hypothetical protein